MSGSRPTVGIRISAEGAEKARREIEALGPAGQKAFDIIQRASSLAQPEMQKLGTSIDVVQRAFIGMGGSLGRVGSLITGVSGVAGTATTAMLALGGAAGIAAVGIAKAGDEATATMARLTSSTGGLAQAQTVYENLFRLSQQTGIAVAESAGSFARFSVAAKEIGGTNDQVLRLVAGIQKAGIVAGATAQETGAAVQQIGQALASGKLQGDELRSLLENLPQLAQALARELGVGIGQLRQMGTEGKLTAEVVFPALLRASEKMGAEFDKMPVTMSRAKDILVAATEDFGQRLDRITKLSQTFAGFMQQGAAALRAAGQYVAPTEREAAERDLAAAQRRLANLRAGRAADAAEPEPTLTAEQRRAQTPFPRDELATTRSRLGATGAPRDATADRAREFAEAEQQEREARDRLNELRRSDRELQRAEQADAAAQARQAAATGATIALKDLAGDLDARVKAREKYAERIKELDRREAQGGTLPAGTSFDSLRAAAAKELAEALEKAAKEEAKGGEEARKAADKRQAVIATLDGQTQAAQRALDATKSGTLGSKELALALEVEAKLHEAGIPIIEKRTEAEKAAAKVIEERVRGLDRIKEAEKKYEEEAKKAKAFQEKSWNELAGIGERAMDRVGDAIVNAFVNGQGAAVNFGNIARGIFSSVISDVAKLAVVNPILNSIFTSSAGPRATLTGAFGGSATGIGGGFDLGSMFGVGNLFSGFGSSVTNGIFGTGGAGFVEGFGFTQPGTPGLFGLNGSTLFGGSAPSFGGMLGGMGAGFGLGNLLGGLIANSAAQRQNSMMGAGLGSLLGALGGPLGSVIGGALGGGLGGLIGPGESVRSYGLQLRSSGFSEDNPNYYAMGSSIAPIDRQYYNESGAAAFQQAEAIRTAVNAYMAANGLQVGGVGVVEGNRNGGRSLGEAFGDLRFSASNAQLSSYLNNKSFDDPAKLQAAVDGFNAIQATITALTAEAVPAFTASLKAVNDNFDAAAAKAREYGLAEDGLTTARGRAVAALEAQRAETLRQSDVSLAIRRLAAGGSTQEAELARQAEAARQELDAFGKSLDALAITAEDRGARLVALEEVQAAERAAIIARFGEQAAASLRSDLAAGQNLLRDLAFGAGSALAPEQKYFAALSTLNQARRDLDAGGSLASYSAIAGQVLPVARDFLGTSQRYAGLAAEVGQVLASRGADGSGLSAILSAQVDGMSGIETTFAAYGDLQVSELRALRADFTRLAAAVEAIITRRSAA